jgi:AcrR family transcriptional regulator
MTTATRPYRPYRQTRRAATTAATRERVLEAAREQLLGDEPFTINAVSRRAGVARVTVYDQFGDRDRLREAVFDHLATTGGLTRIPSAFAATDPAEGIGRLAEVFCDFYATHRTVIRRLHALSALRAGDGELPGDRNRRRRHILVVLLRRLARLPQFQGLDVEGTAITLHALTSFEFYDQLASSDPRTPPAMRIRLLIAAVLRQVAKREDRSIQDVQSPRS